MDLFVDVDSRSAFAPEKMKKNNLFTTERLFSDVPRPTISLDT